MEVTTALAFASVTHPGYLSGVAQCHVDSQYKPIFRWDEYDPVLCLQNISTVLSAEGLIIESSH